MSAALRLERMARGLVAEEGCWKIVPDGVTSSQSDPLRDRSVLLLGSRELLLRTEGLVALQFKYIISMLPSSNIVIAKSLFNFYRA